MYFALAEKVESRNPQNFNIQSGRKLEESSLFVCFPVTYTSPT
jgi:hypothetical protein